jgi:hypothetical protein
MLLVNAEMRNAIVENHFDLHNTLSQDYENYILNQMLGPLIC